VASPPEPLDAARIARQVAADIATGYHAGTSRAEWRRQVAGAAWRDHRGPIEHPPESVRPQHRGLWCSAATDMEQGMSREAVFYGLRTERPVDCRLEQLRYVLEDSNSDGYAALSREIGDFLSAAAAMPEGSLNAEWLKTHELDSNVTFYTAYPSDRWRDLRTWATPTQSIVLYRLGTTIQVLVQTSILTSALRQDDTSTPAEMRYGVDLGTWNLLNELRPLDPGAAELLQDRRAPDQDRLERVILRLLQQRAKTARSRDRVTLTRTIAVLATGLRAEGARPEEARPGLRPLLALGVTFEESPTDQGVWYGGYDPGHRASSHSDPDGTFLYRDVITRDLARVRASPGRVSPDLLLDVATAYETWWSLSLAPDDEEFVTRSDHAAGGASARLQAIRWYERLIRDFPYSRQADRARRLIIQIRVGVDTGQRADFAPYA
jgi:hypothetical protein